MLEIIKTLTFDDLPTRPPITGRPKLSEDIQQTIALLSGWDGATRRLVKVTPTGTLRVGSAKARGITNALSVGDNTKQTLSDIKTSEAMLRAFPDNVGKVFVNINTVADENIGYPLFTGEWVSISVNNLSSLQLWFEKDTDRIAVIYTE